MNRNLRRAQALHLWASVLVVWAGTLLVIAACQTQSQSAAQPSPLNLAPNCHAKAVDQAKYLVLPDPGCTPGLANQGVTQANLFDQADQSSPNQGLCTKDYRTSWLRPSQAYTSALKEQQLGLRKTSNNLYEVYDFTDHSTRDYEEDHLIPLELGGNPNDPRNLWPEPSVAGKFTNPKDGLENYLHNKVCYTRELQLADAQKAIAANWVTLYQAMSKNTDYAKLSARPLYK